MTVIKNAPLHDQIEYKLMDGHISLRRSEARLIEVVCTSSIDQEGYNGTFTEDEIAREISEKSRTINIALVGNPNCGKTSFFNRATGLRERVGNYRLYDQSDRFARDLFYYRIYSGRNLCA